MGNEGRGYDIILFDGVCNLCNSSVQFVIKRDAKDYFRLAPLQAKESQALIKSLGYHIEDLNSIVLISKGKLYSHSTAALKIAQKLSGLWPMFSVFLIIPAPIRDFFYKIIAKHRYKWFGKQEHCMVPTESNRKKFLGWEV